MNRIIKKGELLSYAFCDLGTEDKDGRFVAKEDIEVSTGGDIKEKK